MARDRASRPEAKPLRLFVAIEIPERVRRAVESSAAPWRERFPRARWVPLDNQHVTVKFLGTTWPRLVEWVHESVGVAAAGSAPFESRATGLGAFPSPGRARVLWAGLDDAAGSMAVFASALDEALRREFQPEKRAFTPHLTIARFDPPVQLEGLAGARVEGDAFLVDRVVLYRSHLRRPAPVYEALSAFPLGARDAGGR
jgi:2'-5' RNA ligase